MLVHDISYYSIQNRITQELQPLVVHWFSLRIAVHDALVQQRHLVVADVVRIKTEDFI
jgi:hypothetical protein